MLGGENPGHPKGYWYDGACSWDLDFVDCLCKK